MSFTLSAIFPMRSTGRFWANPEVRIGRMDDPLTSTGEPPQRTLCGPPAPLIAFLQNPNIEFWRWHARSIC
jgi:hypothetical protein